MLLGVFRAFRFVDPIANACTFLLVGRRDPLGVGLRLAVESGRTACRLTFEPACPG